MSDGDSFGASEETAAIKELIAATNEILSLRAEIARLKGGRDELTSFLVKVPAKRGWHRWKKESFRSFEDARAAAATAANAHSKARIVKRLALVTEELIEQINEEI